MKKIFTVCVVAASMIAGASSAQAATPKQTQYIKAVKAAKLASLKKNTNAELIAIGQTLCVDLVFTKGYLTELYKKNHYAWDYKTSVVLTQLAATYLCPIKTTIMNDDGSWTEIKTYEDGSISVKQVG